MANLEILPRWAARYLQEHLEDHAHLVNALPIDRGMFRGAFLVNTSRGAVLLQKGTMGEPMHWLLPLPGLHQAVTCACGERMEFVDQDLPRDMFCMGCGAAYHVKPTLTGPVLEPAGSRAAPPEPAGDVAVEAESKARYYTHGKYDLYERETALRGGGTTKLYFFARNTPKSGKRCALPDGYEVGVSERTNLPFLRRTDKVVVDRFQCSAQRADGKQCRKTARDGSRYCLTHKGYQPRSRDSALAKADTVPKRGTDTLPAAGARTAAGLQCAAITAAGAQCKHPSREGSKYCTTHKGYRPKDGIRKLDTKPVGKGVKDTTFATR